MCITRACVCVCAPRVRECVCVRMLVYVLELVFSSDVALNDTSFPLTSNTTERCANDAAKHYLDIRNRQWVS